MLANNYQLSDPHPELRSAFSLISGDSDNFPAVGVYNGGIITVVDEVAATIILEQWRWSIDKKCFALMTTGVGDVFFWNPANGINHLESQRGSIEFIDSEMEWFLSDFLTNPSVVRDVLKRNPFEKIVQLNRPLRYHEVCILEPWLMLGGADKIENYTIGKCGEYLSLVGNAHSHNGARR